jgi:hypothetical protein
LGGVHGLVSGEAQGAVHLGVDHQVFVGQAGHGFGNSFDVCVDEVQGQSLSGFFNGEVVPAIRTIRTICSCVGIGCGQWAAGIECAW